MLRKIIIFIVLILPFVLLSGCWSRVELSEIAIVSALGIDKEGDDYVITAQVINPSEVAGKTITDRPEVVTFTAKGETITAAVNHLSKDNPRRVYVSHLREVIFGEDLAKEGIGKALDTLSRQHSMRSDFFITIAKGSKAADILKVTTVLEKIPANKLFNVLENAEQRGAIVKTVILDELISSIISKGKQPVLSGVYVYGDPKAGGRYLNVKDVTPETGLRIDTIGVLKKDKLIGWLTEDESLGFNFLTNNVKTLIEQVECENGKITIRTTRSSTKSKGIVTNGIPKIDIQITADGNIDEVACDIDIIRNETITMLEEKYSKKIEQLVTQTIDKAQEYQSDIFGFGEVIRRSNPRAWKDLEQNWDEQFSSLEVNVQVEARIRRTGSIKESIIQDIEE